MYIEKTYLELETHLSPAPAPLVSLIPPVLALSLVIVIVMLVVDTGGRGHTHILYPCHCGLIDSQLVTTSKDFRPSP